MRPWIQRRSFHGQFDALLKEMLYEDIAGYTNFIRTDPDLFHEILEMIGPQIEKQDTNYRNAIEPALKLAVTLRYLATGNSYRSLQYGFRVAGNTISLFVPEVCQAIIDKYGEEIVQLPRTSHKWKGIAMEFQNKWNLPHCIGALDGKHVAIKCPSGSGSVYYNYKHFYSIVLMALVDANYRFIYINVGAAGAGSDGGVFANTDLRRLIEAEDLGIPDPEPLPGAAENIPYYIVADEAFPLRTWLMKPIPRRNLGKEERIFNYRISRARRVVENAFGLLAMKFRCLLSTMPQSPERVTKIVMACCILHNLTSTRNMRNSVDKTALDREDPSTHEVIPGTWRIQAQLPDLGSAALRGNTASRAAKSMRNYMVDYVNSPAGSVTWQENMI